MAGFQLQAEAGLVPVLVLLLQFNAVATGDGWLLQHRIRFDSRWLINAASEYVGFGDGSQEGSTH